MNLELATRRSEIMTPLRLAKKRLTGKSRRARRAFNNDFSFLNPTIWANEAILQLLPNMVMANLVARDFDNAVAKFGDIVNAFAPGQFVMTKKGSLCENVQVQDATGSDIQVALDQWPQVSFLICDGEENRDQIDLINTLLTPGVIAMAQGIDRILSAQVYRFMNYVGGHAGNMDSTNVQQYILETREIMNRNNVPLSGRVMLLTPGTETSALEFPQFTKANEVGDNGSALREAALGRKDGFDMFMTQSQPEIVAGQTLLGTVTVNGATAAGLSTITFGGAQAGSVAVGMWCVIAGDDVPHQITAYGSSIATLNTPLKRAVSNNAVVTIIAGGLVNNPPSGYIGTSMSPRTIGWNKEIVSDSFPANSLPQIGQLVSFGTDITNRYTITALRIINSTSYGITLDRPLAIAVADNAVINLGPAAKYNFAFLRNALTLVNRPLPQPRAGTGAISRVITDPVNKIAIRVTITYDGQQQGHLVTLDTLMGVGVLNTLMGAVMLG